MSVVLSDVNTTKRLKSGVGINNPERMKSLDYYLGTARRVVSKYASKSLSSEILQDEDAISFIAEHIMMGTSRWDESKSNGKSLDNYHLQCALWAIKRWVHKKTTERNKNVLSMDFDGKLGDLNLHETVSDKRIDPEGAEKLENTVRFAQEILNLNCLTDNQKTCIKMKYMDGMTLREIGDKLGKSFQAVQQIISAGLTKIKHEFNISV